MKESRGSLASAAFDIALRHHEAGRLPEAEALYRQILREYPRHADALNCLGLIAYSAGKNDVAVELIGQAIGENPSSPSYYNNQGLPLQRMGRVDDAIAGYRKALSLRPGYAQAHYNLGNALKDKGELVEAVAAYRDALVFKPDFAEALCNLGSSLRSLGEPNAALASYVQALGIRELPEAKSGFVGCVRNIRFSEDNREIRKLVIRALSEPWGLPGDLATVSIGLIKSNPDIAACIDRATKAWPARLVDRDLYGQKGFAAICDDLLLQSLLENAQVCDLELERFLTMVRCSMLYAAESATAGSPPQENLLGLYCALARQCFVNEYCFDANEDELARALALREQLDTDAVNGIADNPALPLKLVAVAAYYPLHTLKSAAAWLSASLPEVVNQLMVQQIREPMEERQIREAIPKLTAIDDTGVDSMRRQYEENPYPTWVKLASGGNSQPINTILRRQFPHARLLPIAEGEHVDVLIAGCGTGRHPIETVQQISRARVLAIDLSLSSLGYAVRKTRELGIGSIDYAQADIMRLSPLERRFDIIESVGVLHHLDDPLAGWRILVSLLRPGGFMRLGLYSETARQTVIAARRFIAERGYRATPEDIRRCRQELMSVDGGSAFRPLLANADFFGTSECRDLLFNVREHCFTLPQIKTCLGELGLNIIGFSIGPEVLIKYHARFPDDQAMADLERWHAYEIENPNTFAGMYQFWVQSSRNLV